MSLLNLHNSLIEQPRPVASSRDETGWLALIAGIRRGDPDAVSDLACMCSNGIRLYLKRRLGVNGLEVLVEQTIASIIEQIREGRIERPADIIFMLHRMVTPHQTSSRCMAADADGAVEAQARILAQELRHYSKRDREMLLRYYVRGQDVRQILQDMGVTESEFLMAKARLKAATTSAGTRKPPGVADAPKMCQKAAAGV
jgi:hypothetical protein